MGDTRMVWVIPVWYGGDTTYHHLFHRSPKQGFVAVLIWPHLLCSHVDQVHFQIPVRREGASPFHAQDPSPFLMSHPSMKPELPDLFISLKRLLTHPGGPATQHETSYL